MKSSEEEVRDAVFVRARYNLLFSGCVLDTWMYFFNTILRKRYYPLKFLCEVTPIF